MAAEGVCNRWRSFSSSLTSCRQLLLLSEVERPVLPGLSSRPDTWLRSQMPGQRQTGAVLSGAKLQLFFQTYVLLLKKMG